MSKELQFLEEVLGKPIMNMEQDQECAAYCGYNFWFDSYQIKYRKAKVTPKKTGCFVALWRRNTKGKTVPFQASDNFDFYLIEVEENENKGRSEEHTSELQSRPHLVCRLLLEKK